MGRRITDHIKKCQWCQEDAVYSYGWRDRNNIRTDNWACSKHRDEAYILQSNALRQDKMAEGIESFMAKVDIKDWVGVVGSVGKN